MTYRFIETQENDGVLVISMNDPGARNALGEEMANEMFSELDRFESDPNLKVLVLTGKDPAFCSGANINDFAAAVRELEAQKVTEHSASKPWELIDSKNASSYAVKGPRLIFLRLHNLQKPSIAAVNGDAFGAGMGLALGCDIRIASENARFCEAFVRNGLVPADGDCWKLPRLIGFSNALLLQYTGDVVSAEESHRLGICSKVVPHQELMKVTLELAKKLASGATFAMGLIKYLVFESLSLNFEESMKLAGPMHELARQTEDHKEAVNAFLEKRPCQYKGR